MSIKQNLQHIKQDLPKHVTLVAVSKTKPIADLQEAYDAGQRIFGENKIQEMADKFEALPKDIKWHMIGHVQSNKVKYMAEFVDLIHGCDSLKLIKEVNKQAKKYDRVIKCLIQIKIAEEDSKFGMSIKDATELLNSDKFSEFKNVCMTGVMGMATFTEDNKQISSEFKTLKKAFEQLKSIQKNNSKLETISMGMSGDYHIAIEEGSTMIRVGSSIFGAR
jgi:pyridoxal phosphate enzyme (YggS family)